MRTFLLPVTIAACLLSSACGEAPAASTGTTTEGTASAGGATMGTGAGGGGSGGAGGATGSGGATTATGGAATTTGDGGTGGGAAGDTILEAFHVDGEYPTVRVFEGDPVNDRCAIMRLALVGSGGGDDPRYAAVARPDGWGVEYVFVSHTFADCFDFNKAAEHDLQVADTASGSVTFGAWPPDTLDIDVTLVFTPDAAWIPPEETLSGTGVPVDPW